MHQRSDAEEHAEVQHQPCPQDRVISLLRAVPTDRLITEAHRTCSQCSVGLGGVVLRRASMPARNTVYSRTASTSQIRKCARRSGWIMTAPPESTALITAARAQRLPASQSRENPVARAPPRDRYAGCLW